jgi:hypothetical protein
MLPLLRLLLVIIQALDSPGWRRRGRRRRKAGGEGREGGRRVGGGLRFLLLFRILLFLLLLPSTGPRRIVLGYDARGGQVGLAFEFGLQGGVHVLAEGGVGS